MRNNQNRIVLSCDHHALLLTSFLRYLNISARVRTGYSLDIVLNLPVPHWVVEVYDEENKSWHIVDPERLKKKVSKDKFLFASEVWQDFQETNHEYLSYSGFSGQQGLKYALLCDLNCLFKNELLSYEWRLKAHQRVKPKFASKSYTRFTQDEKDIFDRLAKLMLQPDENLNELLQIYQMILEKRDLENSCFELQ